MNKISYLKKKVFYNGKNHFYASLNFFLEIEKIVNFKNKSILDIGCGEGKELILYNIIGNAKYSCGIDVASKINKNTDLFKTLNRNIKVLNLKNMKILIGDFLSYDFKEQRFDVITAVNSVHHILATPGNLLRDKASQNSYMDLFKKIYNLLNKGGTFILFEISKKKIKIASYYYQKLINTKSKIYHKNKHTIREYSTILKKSGFNKVFAKYYNPSYYLNKFKFIFSNPIVGFLINAPFFIFALKT